MEPEDEEDLTSEESVGDANERRKDFRTMRLHFIEEIKANVAAVKEHLHILSNSSGDLVALRSLSPGCSTFVKSPGNDGQPEISVMIERRVLRQSCVVFEVRAGSKMRSWAKKQARGTHKRQLWLINEELIVTKEIGRPVVYHELCREFVRQMVVSDVSEGGHCLMAVRFASGFVFTGHFQTRREMDVWMSMLRPDDSIQFPWGLPFEEAGAIDENRVTGREVVVRPIKDDMLDSVRHKLANIEGLVAAQVAAVSLEENFSVRATRKRQLRIQRAMFAVLKEMHQLSLGEARQISGNVVVGDVALVPKKRRRRVRRVGVALGNDAWSESDDSSNDEDMFDAPIDKPQPQLEIQQQPQQSPIPLAPPKDLVPPMPTVPPLISTKSSSADLEQDVLYAVRRQLAIKELELAKVKQQLSNLVNETWRKNLQVAHLKKEMSEQLLRPGGAERGNDNNRAPVATVEQSADVSVSDTSLRGLPELSHALLARIASFLSLVDLSALSQCSKPLRSVVWNGDEAGWQRRLRQVFSKGPIPSNIKSSREQLEWIRKHPVCNECGEALDRGAERRVLGMRLCLKGECLREATMDHSEASKFFAMSADDLKDLLSETRLDGVTVYRRADVRTAALNKFGGHEGLAHRLRVMEKQKMLLSLSKLGHVTSRPKNE